MGTTAIERGTSRVQSRRASRIDSRDAETKRRRRAKRQRTVADTETENKNGRESSEERQWPGSRNSRAQGRDGATVTWTRWRRSSRDGGEIMAREQKLESARAWGNSKMGQMETVKQRRRRGRNWRAQGDGATVRWIRWRRSSRDGVIEAENTRIQKTDTRRHSLKQREKPPNRIIRSERNKASRKSACTLARLLFRTDQKSDVSDVFICSFSIQAYCDAYLTNMTQGVALAVSEAVLHATWLRHLLDRNLLSRMPRGSFFLSFR